MSHCEITLVRNSQDADGYPCGKDSSETCAECGSELCDLHSEACDLCQASLCASCYLSHMRQPHAKPATSTFVQPQRKIKTA